MRHNNPGETGGEVTAGKPWRCRAPPAARRQEEHPAWFQAEMKPGRRVATSARRITDQIQASH
jgi:hypothetical protein